MAGCSSLRDRLRPDLRIHVSATEAEFWAGKADLSRATMPPGVPESLRSVAKRFLDEYHSRLQPFEKEHEVAPGMLVSRTGGHTPGHSVVRLESGGDRLMFGGDSVFPPGFDCPHWHNGFDQEPEETVRVRVGLLRELAATGQPLVPTHVPFPAAGRVAVTRNVFVGYRPTGGTDRSLGQGELSAAPDRGKTSAPAGELCRSAALGTVDRVLCRNLPTARYGLCLCSAEV